MSHPSQMKFVSLVKTHFPNYFVHKKVIEIGSLDVNGSVRQFFQGCDYTGIDIGEGKGVDIVASGHTFSGQAESYDVTISCECLEHNPHWRDSVRNMVRMLRPGGIFILSVAGKGRKEHGTARSDPNSSPITVAIGWDYYKNLVARDIKCIPEFANSFSSSIFGENWQSCDLYVVGVKNELTSTNDAHRQIQVLSRAMAEWLKEENSEIYAFTRRFAYYVGGDVGLLMASKLERILANNPALRRNLKKVIKWHS
jgi:SAM-dependent methyltransferase